MAYLVSFILLFLLGFAKLNFATKYEHHIVIYTPANFCLSHLGIQTRSPLH